MRRVLIVAEIARSAGDTGSDHQLLGRVDELGPGGGRRGDAGLLEQRLVVPEADHADVEIHIYPGAEHGFNCSHRDSYQQRAAAQAHGNALLFLAENL